MSGVSFKGKDFCNFLSYRASNVLQCDGEQRNVQDMYDVGKVGFQKSFLTVNYIVQREGIVLFKF